MVSDHEQLFGNAVQLAQDKPDLVDANRLAQVGVDDQHAVWADLGVASFPTTAAQRDAPAPAWRGWPVSSQAIGDENEQAC